MFALGQPEQEESDGRNETSSCGNRKASEIFPAITIDRLMIGGRGVEARETQRTAREIDKRDNPAGARKLLQDDAINHQRGGKPEGNDVCERIELATE